MPALLSHFQSNRKQQQLGRLAQLEALHQKHKETTCVQSEKVGVGTEFSALSLHAPLHTLFYVKENSPKMKM